MTTPHAALSAADVVALGGWHPRYARVLAVASAGEHGFALVDGNGDGSELEAEHWSWHDGSWQPGSSSGVGPLERQVVTEYLIHYNTARPHRTLGQLLPAQAHTPPPQINLAEHQIRRKHVLDGLISQYQIAA